MALDSDDAVLEILHRNLPAAEVVREPVEDVFNGDLRGELTEVERSVRDRIGHVDVLLGGPPCQGHSDLNNHTRRRDPKNALYVRMARAVEVLNPAVVVVENVPPVQWDREDVVRVTTQALAQDGYKVEGRVLDLLQVGVPQRRRRFILLASRSPQLQPRDLLDNLVSSLRGHAHRTVDWAIRDLMRLRSERTFDTPSKMGRDNRRRVAYLFDHGCYDLPNKRRPECHKDREHSYISMYGRLRGDLPAQTITTGYGSMGQGRYVHPHRPRTLTPHEAARLQTFPDWFDFGDETPRGVLAKAIGNAVPPMLMLAVGQRIATALAEVEEHSRRPA